MARMRSTLALEPPEAGLEFILAHRIHAARSRLEEEILDRMARRPRRYAELQPLLRGRNTNVLNKGIRSLLQQGLLDRFVDANSQPPAGRYELTSLGVAVRDAIVELRFAERVHSATRPLAGAAPS